MVIEIKHTPGPWQRNIKPATKYPTIHAGRNTHVAALSSDSRISPEEAEANIELICIAPDLLQLAQLGVAMRAAQNTLLDARENDWGATGAEDRQDALESSKRAENAFDKSMTAVLSKLGLEVLLCEKCGQKDWGQTGEHPCAICGLPKTWDEVPQSMSAEQFDDMQSVKS